MSNLPKKLMKNDFRGIIADPTVFNDPERLRAFLKSKLSEDYSVAISSDIYFMIQDGNWEDLSALLRNWEWNVKRDKLIEWHRSSEFHELCKDVINLTVPCTKIMEDLSYDEKDILQQVSQVIEPGSPTIVKIAKELIKTSIVKNFPVFSFTRHAKRWFKTCRNVIIMEITEAKNSVSKAKRDLKIKIVEAGWRGVIYLFIFKLVSNKILKTVLPPPIGIILAEAAVGSFLISVLVNGKKI